MFELADVPGCVDFVVGEVVLLIVEASEIANAGQRKNEGSEKRTEVRARSEVAVGVDLQPGALR